MPRLINFLNTLIHDERFDSVRMACITVVSVLQCLIATAFLCSFIPIEPAAFVKKLFPIYLYDVRPEREMLFYRCAIVACIIMQALGMYVITKQHVWDKIRRHFAAWMSLNSAWLVFHLFLVFKIIVDAQLTYARPLLGFSLIACCVTNVFFKEIRLYTLPWISALDQQCPRLKSIATWAVLIVLLGGIGIVNIPLLKSLIYVSDRFYHLDSFVMMPAWGYLNGLKLNIDVISQYSTVIPAAIATIASWMPGGFNYDNVLIIFIATTVIYMALLFVVVKKWLNSRLLAFLSVVYAVNWQMFHLGVWPVIWRFPSATVMRFCWDLPVLLAIFAYHRTQQKRYIALAAFLVGLALAWTLDAGVYLYLTFIVFLAIDAYIKKFTLTQCMLWLRVACIPLMVAMGIVFIINGPGIFASAFFKNTFEFALLFVNGWGALPMTDALKDKQFFAVIIGFIVPCIYLATLLYGGAVVFLRRQTEYIFPVIIAIYGLGLYQYFIHRSAVTSYSVVSIPCVLIGCFWLSRLLRQLSQQKARVVLTALCVIGTLTLVTNRLMAYYPHIGQGNNKELVGYQNFMAQSWNLTIDAKLIQQFSSPDDKVAIISSFETALLMQAQRKPLFYYSPLIDSQLFNQKSFGGTYLHTKERLTNFFNLLESTKPTHIFIETQFINGQLPTTFYQKYPSLANIVMYAQSKYRLQQQGQYLSVYTRFDEGAK